MVTGLPYTHSPSPDESPQTVLAAGGVDVIVPDEDDADLENIDGVTRIETDDGGVVIDLAPKKTPKTGSGKFDENLAEVIDDSALGLIVSDLLQAIEADNQSRQEWLSTRTKGIDMLGFRVDESRDASSTGAPADNMSSVRHPLLAEAVIRAQSNAAAELMPTEGPVRVRNDSPPAPAGSGAQDAENGFAPPPGLTTDDLADALEKDMNHYLMQTDKGYRSDFVRMLFWVCFGGCGFRKVYSDPIKRRPMSRSIDAQDMIVSNDANDIDDAGRITHRVKMRKSTFVRMQIAGVYRDIDTFSMPTEEPDAVEQKVSQIQGFAATPTRPEDHEYTIYECYCELDIPGFKHEDKGKITGLQLPYKVSIEKDSRQILEIRRNWREDDNTFTARKVFVKYAFIPALGFYDIGLLHLIGNVDRALTGAWRIMLDNGMFSNFPGFLYSDKVGRQDTNEFFISPGGGRKIQTGDLPINQVVMPLPYKDVSASFVMLAKDIEDAAQRLAGTAELQVAEGRQDAPVGTMLAMIEQATKIMSAVHVNLHAAQAEEFQLLKEAFQEDPEAFWRHNKRPARKWEVDEFIAALNNMDLVPAADPNTSSHMQRLMKAMAIKQLQAANPQLYDGKEVDQRILRMVGITDIDSLFIPPQAAASPPPDPRIMALQLKAQTQQQEMQMKAQEAQQNAANGVLGARQHQQDVMTESADRAADRASRERVAQTREDTERIKSVAQHEHQMAQIDAKAAIPVPEAPVPEAPDQNTEMKRMRDADSAQHFAPFVRPFVLADGGHVIGEQGE